MRRRDWVGKAAFGLALCALALISIIVGAHLRGGGPPPPRPTAADGVSGCRDRRLHADRQPGRPRRTDRRRPGGGGAAHRADAAAGGHPVAGSAGAGRADAGQHRRRAGAAGQRHRRRAGLGQRRRRHGADAPRRAAGAARAPRARSDGASGRQVFSWAHGASGWPSCGRRRRGRGRGRTRWPAASTTAETGIVLAGPADGVEEGYLVASAGPALNCDVLQVAAGGADSATSAELLRRATPSVAVISSGAGRPAGGGDTAPLAGGGRGHLAHGHPGRDHRVLGRPRARLS